MFYSLAIIPFILGTSLVKADYQAKVWQSADDYPTQSDFPEVEAVKGRPNTAIAFTGGGSRAYVSAFGSLAGFHKLDLMKNVRYMGGISGGTWATMTYTYSQIDDDNVFLGDILMPNEITPDKLKEMNPQCARGFASAALTVIATESYVKNITHTPSDAWVFGVSKTYLEPAGIEREKFMAWNDENVNDIISRNPTLTKDKFIVPKHDRPYPVVGSAIVGPYEGAPYNDYQNFTMLELTPYYTGQMRTLDVEYTYSHEIVKHPHKRTVGGAVESFAFTIKGNAPKVSLHKSQTTATISIPEPTTVLDVAYASGFSSYAPGSFIYSLPAKALSDEFGIHVDFWSPSDPLPSTQDTLLSDGGCYENIPLISFLQRKVDKIVLFFNAHEPLYPSEKYNPYTDTFTGKELGPALTAFFGVLSSPMSNFENRSFEYEKNQVFSKDDYAPVVSALQAAQKVGNGILATFDLTTVENAWWGIPAGQKVQVTFVYLGRVSNWESQLNSEMKALLVPHDNAEDLSNDIAHGPFRSFPHYMTLGGEVNYERANALADLSGWVILQNADLFKKILQ